MKNGQTSDHKEVTHGIDHYVELAQKLEQENEQMKARLWVDSNLTKFDDVLRSNYDKSLVEFADAVIFHLAKLTQSLRGTFFTLNQETQQVEATAGYACTVETLAKSTFQIGEGLIGQAIKGQETIILDNIPANNMVLEASMGQLSGNCVVVIPLMFNQEAYGAVELLYLQEVAPRYLNLLERLGGNIASMLNSIQNNIKTRDLLTEAKELERELLTQEEELRQNMEELTATQEKMYKKEKELSSNVNAINQTISTIEFDMKGMVLNANQLFLQLTEYEFDDIIGKHHRMFVDQEYAQTTAYQDFWDSLRKGKTHSAEFKSIGNQGKEIWLRASYTPVKGGDGTPYKIMQFALDITPEKKLRQDLANQLEAIDRSSAVIEFDLSGNILTANDTFLQAFGYTLHDLKDKHHQIFVASEYQRSEEYRQFWQKLQNGQFIEGEFKQYTQSGEEIWIKGNYNPILDINGKPYKVIQFASDITQEKKLSQDLDNQMAAINKSNAVVEFDLNGHVTDANELFSQLTGYQLEEVRGKHHQIFIDAQEAQSDEYSQFWHKLQNGQFIEGEFKRLTKEGEKIWIKGSYNPIIGLDGEPYKVVKYAVDITQQRMLQMQNAQQLEEIKAVEEEMRQNMEELVATQDELNRQAKEVSRNKQLNDAVLNTAVDVIITMNYRGIIQSINPAVTALFGYEPEEVIGQNIKILMPHKYASKHDGYLKNYAETRQRKIIGIGRKVEAQKKDGTVFDAYISVSEFKMDEEVVYTGFIRDISDLANTQRELQEQLEQVRTTEEELRQNLEEMAATQDEIHRQATELEKSKKQAEAVLNTAIDVIITMNRQGIVQTANPAVTSLFGYKPEEVIGQNIKMLMPHKYASEHDGYLQHYANTGEKKIIGIGRKVEAQKKDGTVFDAYISVSEFTMDEEVVYTGFIRDISDLANTQRELQEQLEQVRTAQDEVHRQATELEKSKKQAEAVLNTAIDVIITMNRQGIVQTANPAVTSLFGYEPEEVIGQNIKMLMPHKYASEHDGYLQHYANTGEKKIIGIGRKVEAQKKDGTVFDAYISVSEFIMDEEVVYTGFIRDISDLANTQRELQEQLEQVRTTQDEVRRQATELEKSKKQAEAVLNTAIDVIITMNRQGIVQTANPAVTSLFGYEPEEVIGQNIKMLMPHKYASEHDGYLQHYASTGEKKIIGIGRKVEAQKKDGTVFDAHISVSEFKVNQEVFYAGFIRDISQATSTQKVLEKQAKISEMNQEKMQAILNTAIDVIITMDRRGIVQSVNPAVTNLLGYEPEEVIGQNIKMLMPQHYAKQHDAHLKNYADTGKKNIIGVGRQVEAQHKDGTVFDAHISVSEFTLGGEVMYAGFIHKLN
ncbi:PAS domain S-box protein [uncultured Microscilla sp.]|uniref:PAS domain S-box protein n=1 Tax=uncultured Microscilla sp. TaxID=432653 RepID=UPI00261A2DE6|nr:PAS domain S-box protein [uncultured Microscilla sp.]